MTQREDDQSIEEFLDGLSASRRKALAAAGFDMDRLRDLGSTQPGARQVRHIATEFGVPAPAAEIKPGLPRLGPARSTDPAGPVAARWSLVVLTTAVGVAAVSVTDIWPAGRWASRWAAPPGPGC